MKSNIKIYKVVYWDGPNPTDIAKGYWHELKLKISGEVLDALCNGAPFISTKTMNDKEMILLSSNITTIVETE